MMPSPAQIDRSEAAERMYQAWFDHKYTRLLNRTTGLYQLIDEALTWRHEDFKSAFIHGLRTGFNQPMFDLLREVAEEHVLTPRMFEDEMRREGDV